MRATFSIAFVIALGYGILRYRRWKHGGTAISPNPGFQPHIGFTRLDGMQSLSLLLDNKSQRDVWVEEIEIFLSDLRAEEQTADPSLHEVQKIRQMVTSDDLFPISLCEAIYKAAGNPQLRYSCVFSSVLRYRVGERQFQNKMEDYRVEMLGLTFSDIRRERKPAQTIQPLDQTQDVPALATKSK